MLTEEAYCRCVDEKNSSINNGNYHNSQPCMCINVSTVLVDLGCRSGPSADERTQMINLRQDKMNLCGRVQKEMQRGVEPSIKRITKETSLIFYFDTDTHVRPFITSQCSLPPKMLSLSLCLQTTERSLVDFKIPWILLLVARSLLITKVLCRLGCDCGFTLAVS